MKVSREESKEIGNVDILAKEIETWKDFGYALREESALLFDEMLSECGQIKITSELLSPKAKTIQLNRYSCS